MLSWSASFYPQPWLNWKRRSTEGFAIDFPLLNVLGFVCYAISTCSFFYSPTIRQQYAARHPASPESTVRLNDVAFGVHAVMMVVLTYSQFFSWLWGFQVSSRQRATRPVLGVLWGSIVSIVSVIAMVVFRSGWMDQNPLDWAWIDVVRSLGPENLNLCAYPECCSYTQWVMSNLWPPSSNLCHKPFPTISANLQKAGAFGKSCSISLVSCSLLHSSSWMQVLAVTGVESLVIHSN